MTLTRGYGPIRKYEYPHPWRLTIPFEEIYSGGKVGWVETYILLHAWEYFSVENMIVVLGRDYYRDCLQADYFVDSSGWTGR